ncbi:MULTISPECIES: hypothetical protein [Kitasatospora]|uniref:Secreted protein n=1 Tax=Kitasatospora setae (strain ATCC 33774 / DSM 43861 / JCM 3304 / KCC A-0304 / NBRC 14216 / KM-6054) TaxID=452652 RepID=E4NF94_KITSK|nr:MULTISPECIES: hypothetical protein [Kitasatospora]BAJ30174.1 hypothetical protein KSE_43910 [Kitasatospora setae KM-6054]
MSRGRHRHSSVLGRLLPPVASGVLVLAAVAALVASPDQIVARSVGVAAVVAVVGLALVLRQRDRAARTSAQLAVVRRMRAEERYEEQIAEAEYAAEVAEERATRFGRRLTAEKSRLAKAETEIARLLRERAVMVAEQALKEAEAARRAVEAARPKNPVTPASYVRAQAAVRHLERQAAAAEARREVDERAQVELRPKMPDPVPATDSSALRPVGPALPAAGAGAGVPAPQRPRATAFSFFGRPGTARAALRPGVPAPAVGDLADVVGDEALADSERYAVLDGAPVDAAQPPAHQAVEQPPSHQHAESDTEPEVVDLTAHDETELLELPELRAGRS